MKVRLISSVAMITFAAAALSGCVSYGNTNALVTPIGVAGVHSFKPQQNEVRDIRFPAPKNPDRLAATHEHIQEQQNRKDET